MVATGALPVVFGASTGADLPLLGALARGPRQPRENYYVDIRALIGGDGEIGAALAAARNAGLGAWIGCGRYSVFGEVDVAGMRIEAAPDARIVGGGAGRAMLRARGRIVRLSTLAEPAANGARSIALTSPASLSAGCRIVIYDRRDGSWLPVRPYYRAGEWAVVSSSEGNLVQLTAPLWDGYPARLVDIYRMDPARFELVGGDWNSDGKSFVRVLLAAESSIEIDRLRSRANEAVVLDRCADVAIAIADGRNDGPGPDGNLVSIANSQRVRVLGGQLRAPRHAVAIGGGDKVGCVPNRECFVENAHLSNDPSTNLAAADIHGNSERCGYLNCTIVGGASIGGASPTFRGSTIEARADGNLAETTEFKGGSVDLTGVRLVSPAVNVGGGRGLIDFGTQNGSYNAQTTRDVIVELSGFSLSAPRLARNEAVIRLSNQSSPARLTIRIDDGALNLPHMVQMVRFGGRADATRGSSVQVTNLRGVPRGSRAFYHENGPRTEIAIKVDF